ncbi:MAG: D-ribose pyranase [Anaerolineales bacterium]|nr:D-ribose pyranase [Anaerolineales bacterium]
MKKIGTLNQPLSFVIAGLGHMDMLVIADAGLPIPSGTQRIDLALKRGIPGFIDTLQVILEEVQVESAIVASEMLSTSPEIYQQLQKMLPGIPIDTIPHEDFKGKTGEARAIVRTGEFTPYANVILIAGVVF